MSYLLINEIQALQHRWKKWLDPKEDDVVKITSFGHIPWDYLCQPMNFHPTLSDQKLPFPN